MNLTINGAPVEYDVEEGTWVATCKAVPNWTGVADSREHIEILATEAKELYEGEWKDG